MTEPKTRRTAAGIAALLAAFVTGAGAALLVDSGRSPEPDAFGTEAADTAAGAPTPRPGPTPNVDLFEGLDLSEPQRAEVDAVLARTRAFSDSLFGDATAALRAESERARREIVALLDDDQAKRFEARVLTHAALRVRRVQVGDSVVREDTLPPVPAPSR